MATNTLVFQKGTDTNVDTSSATPEDGWTFHHLCVVRTGPLVVMHIEATGPAGAAFTLPPHLRPADDVVGVGGGETVQTSTFTVPNEWLLAHPLLASEGARESFELIPDEPGSMIYVVAGFVTLRFASQPYEGNLQTHLRIIYGRDPGYAIGPFTAQVDSGFWEATEDVTLRLLPEKEANAPQIANTYPSVGFFLDGDPAVDPLAGGDSDVDVTLSYLTLRPGNVADGSVSVSASTGVVSSSRGTARATLAWTAGQTSP